MRATSISRSACIALLLGIATPAHATYWNAFNIEGESTFSAQYATYASLNDMLTDQNRTGLYTPNPFGFGTNIVGGGSDVAEPSPIGAVPEPSTWALIIMGFAATGAALRRRGSNHIAAASSASMTTSLQGAPLSAVLRT